MPNELAPCPFCGASGAELVTYHEPGTVMHPWYRIECDHCGAKGPGTDRGTHREDWNRRAAATAPASRGMSYADRIANRLAQWKNWRPTTDAVAIAAEADAEIAALTATTNEAAAQADGRETVFETMQIAFGHKPPPEPMEVAQPVQAQGEAVAVKCWPFVESPGASSSPPPEPFCSGGGGEFGGAGASSSYESSSCDSGSSSSDSGSCSSSD